MSGTHKLLSWLFIAICGPRGCELTFTKRGMVLCK